MTVTLAITPQNFFEIYFVVGSASVPYSMQIVEGYKMGWSEESEQYFLCILSYANGRLKSP